MSKFSILFVCMGNICRSPTAEAVFRHAAAGSGIAAYVEIDSAGTDAYHVGQSPDRRAQQAARSRGYDLSGIRARKVTAEDFERFDLVLAMDKPVLVSLRRICPAKHADRLKLFMSFAEQLLEDEVPDPYYGGNTGFERVLDLIEAATAGLIQETIRCVSAR